MDFAYLLWRQAVGLPVDPIETYRKAAWIREITDFVAIAKSGNRAAEMKRLLKALSSVKLTSATFSLFDPVPFFAEFVLWASSGVSRQRKAKGFLELDPRSSQFDQAPDPAESAPEKVFSANEPAWPLANERVANSPVVARFGLSDLEGRQATVRETKADNDRSS